MTSQPIDVGKTHQGSDGPRDTEEENTKPKEISSKTASSSAHPTEKPLKCRLSHHRTRWPPYRHSIYIAWVVGLVILFVVVLCISKLAVMMKSRNIKFSSAGKNSTNNDGITLQMLALHDSEDDCWVAYHGMVYDMTDYADRHPADPEWITWYAGTDATEEFAEFHSESLLRTVSKYALGPLLLNTNDDDDAYSRSVTYSELSLHNTEEDCWVAFHGHVYDMTEYAPEHPAGSGWITEYAGTDATEEYSWYHRESLLDIVGEYWIGPLVEDDDDGDDDYDDYRSVTYSELSLHNTEEDCWVAYHGHVYDMTEYAPEHPAGSGWITEYAGTDATEEYSWYHRESLLDIVDEYWIGPLVED